jgi:hypothetical protein
VGSAARVVKLAHQKRCRCESDGPLTCAECDGLLYVVSRRAAREELLRQAVQDAARQFLAAYLRRERAEASQQESGDLVMYEEDALQALRDSLAGERKARHG